MDETNRTELRSENESSIVGDIYLAVKYQVNRDAEENGAYTASAYESYSLLIKALEDKDAAGKDLKDCMKTLWTATKENNEDMQQAYLQEIERVARASAQAWVVVAALAVKANESAARN